MTPETLSELKNNEPAVMLYFHNDVCGVCKVLWPKVEALMRERFPLIKVVRVDANESRELAGQIQMMSIPGLLLYMDGHEYYRGNGMVSMSQMEEQIARPYHLMFDQA
ncbi:MAG: thioredoxin family protein [Bacteroidales bacterium]|jgi:thioredoxin-like negative regulator of GroEL|nr:thioredoxin family protein [Bacteroidales bacterium]NLM93661.1 thioredoxin family protein [Bacteroidales bacterium]